MTIRKFQFAHLDVFTSRPLEGNQLAVFTDARGLSDQEMQKLAREMNLAETTFILPRDEATERVEGHKVRIFTVNEELPFAGHPTLGSSVDSAYSHIAWVRNMQHNFGVKVPFPLIADLDQKVARAFGMVHEAVSDTATVRAVFIIDPKNIIRAIIYYPMSLGRNVDEIVRIVDALQTADANACSTPANWLPGDAVIVPVPATQADAEKRVAKEFDVSDWYLSTKKLVSAAAKS